MSALKNLETITDSEKAALKELLLDRILELENKKESYEKRYDSESMIVKAKILEVKKLIKFNSYLYHWLEGPPTMRLQ